MLSPIVNSRIVRIRCAGAAGQTLPVAAAAVIGAVFLDQNAANGAPLTVTNLTPVTGAPQAGEIQFTGTPSAPATALTLSGAATAGTLLLVEIIPQGAIPSAA